MNDLLTRIEEHVIALQDADVLNKSRRHVATIALLREAKDEIVSLESSLQERVDDTSD